MSASRRGPDSFISDLAEPGMVHVHILRSPIASGRIVSLSVEGLPRDYRLILPGDIPGSRSFRLGPAEAPVLASERVSYPGEPIALIVGPDAVVCAQLAEGASIECEEEWPHFSFESFSSDQIVCKRVLELGGAEGETDPFQDDSLRQYERTYRTGSQDHYYPEPQGAFVSFDYDKMLVRVSTQWPFHVRSQVAAVLGISEDDVLVEPAAGGMHLDGKLWFPSLLAVYAALGASVSGKSARVLLSRADDFFHSPKRSRSAITLKAAADKEGGIAALNAQVTLDTGAYGFLAGEILERTCSALACSYRLPSLRVEGWAIRTNTLPLGPCAGLGMAQSFFALESFVSEIIEDFGLDPVEWRKAHALSGGDPLPGGESFKETPPLSELAAAVMKSSDFRRKHASYELLRKRSVSRRDGPLRGIAFTFASQANGFLTRGEAGGTYSVEAVLGKDLGLTVMTSAVPTNPGIIDIWKRKAAQILSLDPASVAISSGSTEGTPNSGPSTLSRNVSIVTSLITGCAEAIQKKRFRDALPIQARKTARSPAPRDGRASMQGVSLSWAACVVEVEIDRATLEPEVKGIWMAIDAGAVLDASRAANSTEAAVATALSWASRERMEFVDGRVSEHIFGRYSIPRSDELPRIEVSFLARDAKEGPKGIGELPGHLIPAAYSRAIAQALGRPMDSLPVDPAIVIAEAGRQ